MTAGQSKVCTITTGLYNLYKSTAALYYTIGDFCNLDYIWNIMCMGYVYRCDVGGHVPYGAKFSRSIIFAFFTDDLQAAKIWRYSQLNIIRGISRHDTTSSRAILGYSSKAWEVEKLPVPLRGLAKDIPSSAISSANTVMCRAPAIKGRSTDARLLPVSLFDNCAASEQK